MYFLLSEHIDFQKPAVMEEVRGVKGVMVTIVI